jgi:hypothetical protein
LITVGGAILITGLITVVTGALILGLKSPSDFIAWQHSYVTRSMYWVDNPVDSIVRSFRGIIELHLAHAFHVEGLFGDWSLDNESGNYFNFYKWLILRIAQAFILIFLLILTIGTFIGWFKTRPINKLQLIGLLSATPFFLFSFFFTPDSTNYRIFYLPGFILFVAPGYLGTGPNFARDRIESVKRYAGEIRPSPHIPLTLFILLLEFLNLMKPNLKRVIIPGLLIAALFASNFIVKYLPESDPARNPYISEAQTLALSVGPGDLVVYSGAGDDYLRMYYTKYFTRADVTYLPELINIVRYASDDLLNDIRKRIDEGHTILIHEDALFSPDDMHSVNSQYGTNIGDTEFADYLEKHVTVGSVIEIGGNEYLTVGSLISDGNE